jgi:hypothetical protein
MRCKPQSKDTKENLVTKTLSLNLSPEVQKIMPWIISAKASGKHTRWAHEQYEYASRLAREREAREREAERRRLEHEARLRESEERAECERQARRKQEADWARRGIHFVLDEDGYKEIQPTQSSQKGWRRLLSEHSDLRKRGRYGDWGNKNYHRTSGHYSVKHNYGRKPRSRPRYK